MLGDPRLAGPAASGAFGGLSRPGIEPRRSIGSLSIPRFGLLGKVAGLVCALLLALPALGVWLCTPRGRRPSGPILANLRNLALAEARAATDVLTGLPNRRAIMDTLKRMLAQSARTASPMAPVLIDLDHFKQIKDTFGHGEGDAVLAAVGDTLSDTVRTSDFVAQRW